MLGICLLNVGTNDKFPYFLAVFFELYSWFFQSDGPEF